MNLDNHIQVPVDPHEDQESAVTVAIPTVGIILLIRDEITCVVLLFHLRLRCMTKANDLPEAPLVDLRVVPLPILVNADMATALTNAKTFINNITNKF